MEYILQLQKKDMKYYNNILKKIIQYNYQF
jgi:hypothetical protein